MAIKFLKNYETRAVPPEVFTAGQTVKTLSPESELHFVSRRVAGYVGKGGALTDHEGKEIGTEASIGVVTVNVASNRRGGTGRAGEVELTDGTPQRASNGPGVVVTSAVLTGDVKTDDAA